jgi:hypothetical protein
MTESCIFVAAVKLPPGQRAAYLDGVCQGQPELRRQVEELLHLHDQGNHFLAQPALAEALLTTPEGPGELGRLGPYRVLKLLGAGGMGVVFEAEDVALRRLVALKVMKARLATDPAARLRFLREARAAAALKSDHVVVIHAVDEAQATPFLAMELLEGETLASRLGRGPRLTIPEVLRVGWEAADGLAAAHARGLVHRDIKPANLWLERPAGRVKILDFGLARPVAGGVPLTERGAVLGTPGYLAPEQARGEAAGPHSDLFSLGCVVYEMATGQAPFRGNDLLAVLTALAVDRPRPPGELNPDVPPPLENLIFRLLARDPEDRPVSAAEVGRELRALAGQVHAGASAAGARHPRRRWRAVAAALAALAAVAVGTGVAFAPPWQPAAPAPPPPLDQPAPLKGTLDIRVTEPGNPRRQGLLLHQPLALPLQAEMWMEIEAEVNRPAYLYVVYLDSNGKATPLFPWLEYDWRQRPAEERRLRLYQKGPLAPSPSGVESLLLLVRAERLPDDVDLAALFAGLPRQNGLPDPRARAWFENGELVRHDRDRGPVRVGQGQEDAVLRTQALLRGKLRPLFPYTRAVCFAFQGD